MNVIDALGGDTSLHRVYGLMTDPMVLASLPDYPGDESAQQEVWLKRYRNFRAARQREGLPAAVLPRNLFVEDRDHSQLKRNVRPMLIELMGIEDNATAPQSIEGQSFIFPDIREFDVRMLPGGQPPAIVITEGTLDLVWFYA